MPSAKITSDARLSEIGYGQADGLTFHEFAAKYPQIVEQWNQGEDPPFPGGESMAQVSRRLENFLATLSGRSCLIVTHNVVLRCLLGQRLGLPICFWHLIPVDHLEEIRTTYLNGRIYLNLTPLFLEKIRQQLVGKLK